MDHISCIVPQWDILINYLHVHTQERTIEIWVTDNQNQKEILCAIYMWGRWRPWFESCSLWWDEHVCHAWIRYVCSLWRDWNWSTLNRDACLVSSSLYWYIWTPTKIACIAKPTQKIIKTKDQRSTYCFACSSEGHKQYLSYGLISLCVDRETINALN